MASFTDIIPQFNPYIQQLPVDAMVKVGMQKQAMYDAGIQKIQTNIDNIAGLDIIRDVDRAYLQSKLNDLGNNLKMVAAGDFSNFQLVNSVSGMTNQITKDPTVQRAVNSTALYRKETKFMEDSRKDGKWSIQNQWDFNNRASKWLYSNDLNKSFSDTYSPYIDVDKKWLEVMKGLHSDLTEEDIAYAYKKKADGSIDYGETLAAMQRVSKERVSSAKIENALRSSLSPDELNQLSINGRYQFRGYDTPDKLAVYSNAKYNSLINQNDQTIKSLQGYANLNSSNPTLQKQALDTINQLKVKNLELKASLADELEMIAQDPEGAKASIYTNGAITQFAMANSWEHNKLNLLENPVLKAEHWEKDYALSRSKFNLDVRAQNWKEYYDSAKLAIDQQELDLKIKKLQQETFGIAQPFETYLGEDTNIVPPLRAMTNDASDATKEARNIVNQIAKDRKATVDQVEAAIAQYNSGDPKQIEFSKSIIPVEWREEADRVIALRAKAKRLEDAIKAARVEVGNTDEFKDKRAAAEKAAENLPGITVKDEQGNNITFTPTEVLAYLGKRNYNTQMSPGNVGYSSISYSNLTPKEQYLYSAEQGVAPGQNRTLNQSLMASLDIGSLVGLPSKEVQQMEQISGPIKKILDQYSYEDAKGMDKYFDEVDDKVNELLLRRTGKYVPRLTTITFSSEGGDIARRTWEGIASSALQRFKKGQGGDAELSESNIETGLDALTSDDRQKIIYKKLTQGDKTFLMMVTNGKEIVIPLEQVEAAQLPITDVNEPSKQYADIVEAQYLGDGSTNPTGKPEDAFFNRGSMPNVKNINAKADLKWSKGNTGKQFMTLRVQLPTYGWVDLTLDDYPVSREGAMKFINNLTDDDIKTLFIKSDKIPDTWKDAIRSIK